MRKRLKPRLFPRPTPVGLVWLIPVSSLGKERLFFPAESGGNPLTQEAGFRHQVVNVAQGFREGRHRELCTRRRRRVK
jgi:hypothetical protein